MIYDLSQGIDVKRLDAYIDSLKKNKSVIELKKHRQKRSINQNSYLHVCIQFFCSESGYTIPEAKTLLKRSAGLYYEKNGEKFLKSTTDLNTQEMTIFIDHIKQLSVENLGVYIPTPEEYINNQFEIMKQLKHVR